MNQSKLEILAINMAPQSITFQEHSTKSPPLTQLLSDILSLWLIIGALQRWWWTNAQTPNTTGVAPSLSVPWYSSTSEEVVKTYFGDEIPPKQTYLQTIIPLKQDLNQCLEKSNLTSLCGGQSPLWVVVALSILNDAVLLKQHCAASTLQQQGRRNTVENVVGGEGLSGRVVASQQTV